MPKEGLNNKLRLLDSYTICYTEFINYSQLNSHKCEIFVEIIRNHKILIDITDS